MKVLLIISAVITAVCGKPGWGPGEQDWGYVTVRPKAHMFWWFYETAANVTNITARPLVIWLQGGPGSSSIAYGNLYEIGPLDENLGLRNYTWVKDANLLFIDNPVGAGFSYVEETSAFVTNNNQIAQDLVVCLKGFYEKHPEFLNVPLFIFSESYGGKMAVDFALKVDKEVKSGTMQANLLGISLIDSWISPEISVATWHLLLYYLGVIDLIGQERIKNSSNKVVEAIRKGQFEEATRYTMETYGLICNVTRNVDFYNILNKVRPFSQKETTDMSGFMDNDQLTNILNKQIKEALKLPVNASVFNGSVYSYLMKDFMTPVTHVVEHLLNQTDIKVQVVTGQLDLIVDTPGTIMWVDELKWAKSREWKNTTREIVVVDGYIEGYKKVVGNLSLYVVLRAGHMVPRDNSGGMQLILRELIH